MTTFLLFAIGALAVACLALAFILAARGKDIDALRDEIRLVRDDAAKRYWQNRTAIVEADARLRKLADEAIGYEWHEETTKGHWREKP